MKYFHEVVAARLSVLRAQHADDRLSDDVRRCQDIGIQQLTFDYRTGDADEMLKIIEHFAAEAVPAKGD